MTKILEISDMLAPTYVHRSKPPIKVHTFEKFKRIFGELDTSSIDPGAREVYEQKYKITAASTCTDCNGTGEYCGFNVKESCLKCDGTGSV